MFIQLKDLQNLDIKEGKINDISFNCTIHDELLDKDKQVQITIPRAYPCNAKLIKDKKITTLKKENGEKIDFHEENVKLRLDFVLIPTEDEDSDESYYYKAKEIDK